MQRYGAKLHAYCLMTNHVHLLLTPDHEDSISRVVQHVGRQYVKYINQIYKRTGTLWEGRHKGSIVDADNYLFACYRYIELNPVTGGMVSNPADYPWSSFNSNAWGKPDDLITPHPLYFRLAELGVDRQFNYRELFNSKLQAETIREIRTTLRHNHAIGCDRFKTQIEDALGRKIGHKKPGRPKKETRA
jgi:putative transposase